MNQLSIDQQNFAQEIMARSGANNFCLFLFSLCPGQTGVRFICNYGMSEEVTRGYVGGLWSQDPFLNYSAQQLGQPTSTLLVRRQLEAQQREHRAYWHFIDGVGYRDIIAAIHPFSSEVFLVGGLMRQEGSGPSRSIESDYTLEAMNAFTAEAANAMMADWLLPLMSPAEGSTPKPKLTPRERQIVNALAKGFSNKQIAALLSLSQYTVENYLKRLFKKFGVHNRTALLAAVGVIERA